MINRKSTFENIKIEFGLKSLSQEQVSGFDAIFDEADKQNIRKDYLDYILATVWHEVGINMQPIEEIGKGKGLRYGKRVWFDNTPYTDIMHIFYGRGHTQNTWRDNYEKLTKANSKGWDFVNHPELLLKTEPSIWATFYAMQTGMYTSRKLSQYFGDKLENPEGARKIINGTDKAEKIAGHYYKFKKATVYER